MYDAMLAGDEAALHEAAANRDKKIEMLGLTEDYYRKSTASLMSLMTLALHGSTQAYKDSALQ